jgi:hypothetical protein
MVIKRSKLNVARELLDKMGTKEQCLRIFERLLKAYPLGGMEKVMLTGAQISIMVLLDQMATMYAEEFSEGDLESLLEFFSSNIGQRLRQVEQKLAEEHLRLEVLRGINPRDYIPPLKLNLYWK